MSLPLMLSLADDLDQMSVAPPLTMYCDPSAYFYPRRMQPMLNNLAAAIPPIYPTALRGARQELTRALPKIGKDGFQVCLDVGQFKPNELVVKVVGQSIVVEGRHEEREDDHGYISRHFVRRYSLPEGYESEKVMSTLSSDGVLTLTVPKPPAIEENGKAERIVQIQQVGPAHLNVKKNEGAADNQDRGDATKTKA